MRDLVTLFFSPPDNNHQNDRDHLQGIKLQNIEGAAEWVT